jgi:hypothetical protein
MFPPDSGERACADADELATIDLTTVELELRQVGRS